MNQQQMPDRHGDLRTFANFVTFIIRSLAVSIEVFLHRPGSFGERYFGLQAAAAALLMFFYPVMWEGHDPRPVLCLLIAYLAMCAVSRVAGFFRRRRGGPQVHSYYTGNPWIMGRAGRLSELTVKGAVEPCIVFAAGAFTLPVSQPLGSYLMLAAFGLAASVQLMLGYERTRTLDMNDAFLDQREAAERFRDMRGE